MSNLIGQSLGRYHILEQLGEGGMAIVYKAYDTRLERDVAVKVIRTEKLTIETMGKTLKRFEREAKALAKLTHPNIVPITDYGEHDEKPYLVMPYLPGGTLKQRLGKLLPWEDSVRLLIPIARALHYAHQQGIIHRDVKPSNILITQSGEPMLTDFGIAKILLNTEETADLTGTGMGVGTPEYMAPEQANSKTVDHRVDIYALGIVLYEMVTGRKPFVADTPMAVLIKQATVPLPRPGQFTPDLPDKVEKLLLKALAKHPADRYASMGDFANALESLLTESALPERKQPIRKRDNTLQVPEVGSESGEIIATKPAKTALGLTAWKPQLTKDDWITLFVWVLITSLGWAVGWGMGNVLSNLELGVYSTWIAGAVFTLLPALGQWWILRDWGSKAGWWIIASTLAWALSWGIADMASMLGQRMVFLGMHEEILEDGSTYFSADAGFSLGWFIWDIQQAFIIGGLVGLLSGFGQWLVLRRWIKKAGWWIPISILAGVLNLAVLHILISSQFAVLNQSLGWEMANAVIGALTGLVASLVTGLGLELLKQNPRIPTNEISRLKPHAKAIGWVILPSSIILLVVAQVGGSGIQNRAQDQANATAISRATATQLAIEDQFTPTATPTPTPVLAGTPYPRPVVAISPANAAQVVQLARWGMGSSEKVVFSPDGRFLAIPSTMGIYLYDAQTLQELRLIENKEWASEIAFAPDGETIAADSDNAVKIWRISDGTLLQTLEGHTSSVVSIALSPDGKTLASGAYDNTVRLWRVNDGTLLRTLVGHTDTVENVAFTPDGETLASGSDDNTVRIWRVSDGTLLRTLEGLTNWLASVAFSPDGQILASTGDNTVLLWRVSDGTLLYTLGGIGQVTFSPDGQILATGSDDGTVKIWRVSDGTLLRTLEGHTDEVQSVAFTPDGETLASTGYSTVLLWRVTDGTLLHTLEGMRNVVFAPDSQTLVSWDEFGPVKFWRVSDGMLLSTLEGYTDIVGSVAFSPDGMTLASGGDFFSPTRLWRVSDGTLLRILEGRGEMAFSLDGIIALGDWDYTVKAWLVRLWRASDGMLLRSLEGHTRNVEHVAFSPDGQILASGSDDNTVRLWRVSDGTFLRTLAGDTELAGSMAFSPDGQILAAGLQDNTVRLWHVSNGSLLYVLEGHTDWARSVAFAPDGKTLASGSDDGTMKIWRVSDGTLLRTLDGGSDWLTSVAFSPDGQILALGDGYDSVQLWQVSDGTLLRILEGYAGYGGVRDLAFSPDGQFLASGMFSGVVQLWGIAP